MAIMAEHKATVHRQPPGAAVAGPLKPSEVVDTADTAVKEAPPKLTGRRIRGIPAFGGTTIEIREEDFANAGIDHPNVIWDFRKDDFTVRVGEGISQEAADYLTKEFPSQFVYVSS
jgi:hypothetical protein